MTNLLTEKIIKALGHKGRLVSGSKSCGPEMAVYNSNVVVGEEVVWYGDVDVHESKDTLIALSKRLKKDIEIYYESALRMFNFEQDPKKAKKVEKENIKKQKEKILKKDGLVWTTAHPNIFSGIDYNEYFSDASKRRKENITQRQIYYGFLTPRGTEWTWYNKWFYKGPYKVYEKLSIIIELYVRFPYKTSFTSDSKLSFFNKVRRFFLCSMREYGYQHDIQWLIDLEYPS